MQKPELHEYEEQEDDDGTAGAKEVLPLLPQASAAPGYEVR